MNQTLLEISHNSTESEVISLDLGLRMDGIPALGLWDLFFFFEVMHSAKKQPVQGDLLRDDAQRKHTNTKTKKRTNQDDIELFNVDHVTTNASQRVINDLDTVDVIHPNVQSSHQEALLYVFEDNEAVIKMIIEGRSPTMRHVSRTHRVAFHWMFDRINRDPKNEIKYVDTKNQLADMLTNTRDPEPTCKDDDEPSHYQVESL